MLSVETISQSIQSSIENISEVNPNVTIMTTVSPVRHIKDGFVENSLSKAHLISAIHNFLNQYFDRLSTAQSKISNLQSFYFPSFEIMMDELRDYRFYAEDLLHPNKTAIEIIWQKFSTVWISSETDLVQKKISSIQNGLLHRPFNPKSAEHIQFLENVQQKITALQQEYPHISF